MSFRKLLSDRIPDNVEEAWVLESQWAGHTPGRAYYDVHLETIKRYETATPVFERLVGRGGYRILESGCATGRWMAYFEALGNVVFGVDHSLEQLCFAHRHAPEFHLAGGDVLAVPFRDNSFDAVLSAYVAEHFEGGPGRVLAEARRVLRPDGLLLLQVPFANPWRRLVVYPLFRLRYALWRLASVPLRLTELHFAHAELLDFVRRAGFAVVETHPDDYRPPWTKGLYCDMSDLLGFLALPLSRPFQFGRFGSFVLRLASHLPLWWHCEGILVVARCQK